MVEAVADLDEVAGALLGREPWTLRWESPWWRGKVVLVTGSAGSVGVRLVRQLAGAGLARVVLVDHQDSALFDQWRQPCAAGAAVYLGSVADTGFMQHVLSVERPDVVIHLAAKKMAPLVEVSPYDAFRVNVAATIGLAELAVEHGCECFVHASSFDAFEPNGVFGSTKLAAEHLVDDLGVREPRMRCVNVRFPAVLLSTGSVSTRFLQLAARGEPLVVSSPEATRQFCSLAEAACGILAAAADPAVSGTVSIPVGEPLRIVDLAARTIAVTSSDSSVVVDAAEHRAGDKVNVATSDRLGLFDEGPSGLLQVPGLRDRETILRAARASRRAVELVDLDALTTCTQEIVQAAGWTEPTTG